MRKQQAEAEFEPFDLMPSLGQACDRCGNPGAGSRYMGGVYHMTCKMEAKLDDGVLGAAPTVKPKRDRRKEPARRENIRRVTPAYPGKRGVSNPPPEPTPGATVTINIKGGV